MNTHAIHHSALEAERRMLETRRWATNERLLRKARACKPFVALLTPIAQWVATVVGRLRRVEVTTCAAPKEHTDTQTGPLII